MNEARSLLINLRAGDPTEIGDEFTSPLFLPKALPTYLSSFRSRLFGRDPDRVMLNYRAAQLLQLIHGCELAQYLRHLDPRITYLDEHGNVQMPDPGRFGYAVTSSSTTINVIGQSTPPDLVGRCSSRFVLAISGGALTVNENAYTLGGPYPLGETGYSVHLPEMPTSDGFIATIEVRQQPQFDLGSLLASLDGLDSSHYLSLFGTQPSGVYAELKSMWQDNLRPIAYRLGSFVLAIIFRTAEIEVTRG